MGMDPVTNKRCPRVRKRYNPKDKAYLSHMAQWERTQLEGIMVWDSGNDYQQNSSTVVAPSENLNETHYGGDDSSFEEIMNYWNNILNLAVADIIRTLGPRSMLKILLDAAGGIVVTNGGNAILRELDLAHPAAKSMIELSRKQDEEVGDGTSSIIVLAGEMLHVAEAFIDKNYHPTVICRAYNKALEDAIAALDKIATTIDVKDRSTVLGLVKSCIGTKLTSQFGDLIAVSVLFP
ncbi:T-complex protein 1 subunit gamma-like [Hibiscus syriacus]|uniref:T-complex protein 1 subunit gamma-like n=1 Tax=Hibiscus syriacus TaxID=106335 RepID=UPI00192312BA|nr:T-complex protein 1 subunit gamma-like [Hibiscus syriacus]